MFPKHTFCTKNRKIFQSYVGHCSGLLGLHLGSMVFVLWSAPEKVKQLVMLLVDIADNLGKPAVNKRLNSESQKKDS